jgi:regulatory protein
MARITAIETQKRNPDRVNIWLDGHHSFTLAAIVAAGLRVGQDLDHGEIDLLQSDDALESAYQRALRFLSVRTRSEAEISGHLLRHKTPSIVVERTLDRLRRSQLADDSRFAQAWIENRTSFRPRSRRALTWELSRKGVPAEAIESATSGLDDTDLAFQAGLKQARRLHGYPWADFRRRLYAYLSRRGFSSGVIGPVVARLWTETPAKQLPIENEDVP